MMLTIFLYLPSCNHSSPKRGTLPERSVAGWGGGACGGGVPLRPPGRPPESGLAQRVTPRARRNRLSRLCVGQKSNAFARGCELARPGLRRGRVRERLKARRRRALPHGPERATGSVGRGDFSLRLCGTRDFRPRRNAGAILRAGVGWKNCVAGQG